MAVFLRLPANEEFHFVAGQYLDIMLPQNRRRSFSIASCPGRDELIELHIRRVASGEFTQQLFDGMKEKTLLRVEGPLGQFWFRRESPRWNIRRWRRALRRAMRRPVRRGDSSAALPNPRSENDPTYLP